VQEGVRARRSRIDEAEVVFDSFFRFSFSSFFFFCFDFNFSALFFTASKADPVQQRAVEPVVSELFGDRVPGGVASEEGRRRRSERRRTRTLLLFLLLLLLLPQRQAEMPVLQVQPPVVFDLLSSSLQCHPPLGELAHGHLAAAVAAAPSFVPLAVVAAAAAAASTTLDDRRGGAGARSLRQRQRQRQACSAFLPLPRRPPRGRGVFNDNGHPGLHEFRNEVVVRKESGVGDGERRAPAAKRICFLVLLPLLFIFFDVAEDQRVERVDRAVEEAVLVFGDLEPGEREGVER